MSTGSSETDEMRQLSILAEIYFTLFDKFKIDSDNPDEQRLNQLKDTKIGYFLNGIFDTLVNQNREQAFAKLKLLKNLQDKWDENIPGPFTLPQKFQPEKSLNGKRPLMMLGETQSADGNSQLGTSPTLTNESPVKKLKTEQNIADEGNNIEPKNAKAALKSENQNFQGYLPPKYIVDIYKLYLPTSKFAVLGSQKKPMSRVFCEGLFLKHSVVSKTLEEKNQEETKKMLDLVEKIETEEQMNGVLSDEAVQKLNLVLEKSPKKDSNGSPDLLAQALGLSPSNDDTNVPNLEKMIEKENKIMEIEVGMKEVKKPSFLDLDQKSKSSSKKSESKELKADIRSWETPKSEMLTVDKNLKAQVNKETKEEKIKVKQHELNKNSSTQKEVLFKESQREDEEPLRTEKVLENKVDQLSFKQNLIDMRKNVVLENEANTMKNKKPSVEFPKISEVRKDSSSSLQSQGPKISDNKNQTSLKPSALLYELLQKNTGSKISQILKVFQQEQEKQKAGGSVPGTLKSS